MKKVLVLGAEKCTTCSELKQNIAKVIQDGGFKASVEKITDIAKVMSYGVMSMPAVVIDDQVKCVGRVPDKAELIQWLA